VQCNNSSTDIGYFATPLYVLSVNEAYILTTIKKLDEKLQFPHPLLKAPSTFYNIRKYMDIHEN